MKDEGSNWERRNCKGAVTKEAKLEKNVREKADEIEMMEVEKENKDKKGEGNWGLEEQKKIIAFMSLLCPCCCWKATQLLHKRIFLPYDFCSKRIKLVEVYEYVIASEMSGIVANAVTL
jgi:hypothetical protein